MYPASFCSVFHIAQSNWVAYLNQDPVHRYVYPYVAATYFDGVDSPKTAKLLAKMLPLLQASIEDPIRMQADSTISAVLALASAADLAGDIDGLQKHVGGLNSLVKMRGGVRQLLHTELQIKCCR